MHENGLGPDVKHRPSTLAKTVYDNPERACGWCGETFWHEDPARMTHVGRCTSKKAWEKRRKSEDPGD